MIIDCCMFAGELDMLKFRMAILYPVVDIHVVVENAWTHQGKPRERILTKDLIFTKRMNKLNSYFLDIDHQESGEFHIAHRNAMVDCLSEFDDNDQVIFTDVDEIPSREAVIEMAGSPMPQMRNLELYLYRLNWRRPEKWPILGMSTMKHLREVGGSTFINLRGVLPVVDPQPSGWHLSYFGGTEAIQNKLSTWGHPQFNTPEFLDKEWLDKCQKEGISLLKCGTPLAKATPADFPQYFLDAAPKEWWL